MGHGKSFPEPLCVCVWPGVSRSAGAQLQHIEQKNKAAIISRISSTPCLDSLTPRDKQWQGSAAQLCWGTLKRTLKRTGRSIKHTGDTLAVDKHQHNRLQHWLPQRWESTEYTASSDKGREGSSWATDSWKASANWPAKTQHRVYFVWQMQYTQSIHSGACKQQSSTGSVCKSNINL